MSQTQPELTLDEAGLPVLTPAFLSWFFEALSAMEVTLDENPLDYGPRRLNNKTAVARTYLTETEGLFLQISQLIQKYKSSHRAANTALRLAKMHLFANDPETKAGRNQTTQDAIASTKLEDEVQGVDKLASSLEDLEALLVVIKSKRADLRDVQGRIRDQTKLCQEEIGLGGRWGSKPPPGTKAPELKPDPDAKSFKDLQRMFSGGDESDELLEEAEESLEQVVTPLPASNPEGEEVFVTTTGDAVADGFLDALEAKPRKSLDLDAILEGFDI